jgi:hypothetical protein
MTGQKNGKHREVPERFTGEMWVIDRFDIRADNERFLLGSLVVMMRVCSRCKRFVIA